MTNEVAASLAPAPDACTLPTADQPLRLAEFEALFAAALRDAHRRSRQDLRLTLAGGAELAATVRDLTAREAECCSFFTFTVTTPQPGELCLDIQVPPAHAGVLDALAALATTHRSTR